MLARFFSSVRRKPQAVRDQYALGIALVFTLLVASVWMVGLTDRVTTDPNAQLPAEPAGVFASFWAEISSSWGVASEVVPSLDTLREVVTEPVQTANVSSVVATSTPAATTPATAGRPVRIATTTTATATQ